MPCAPYMVPFGRGGNGHEKTPSVAGGVRRVRAMRLNQRARPPGTPPAGVVVVVVTVRPIPLMPGISRAGGAPSRQALLVSTQPAPVHQTRHQVFAASISV